MAVFSRGSLRRVSSLSLRALEALPCGCVTSIYQAPPAAVEVESVEAKGPHCLFSRHRAGHVTWMGAPEVRPETREAF